MQHTAAQLTQGAYSPEEHTPSLTSVQILVKDESLVPVKHPLAIQEKG